MTAGVGNTVDNNNLGKGGLFSNGGSFNSPLFTNTLPGTVQV